MNSPCAKLINGSGEIAAQTAPDWTGIADFFSGRRPS